MIDAFEVKYVAIIGIPGDLLMADQYEVINMTIRGKLFKLMVNTAIEVSRKYVITEIDMMVLYVQLLKALYGCMYSVLLFYKKILSDIKSRGFDLNPYDP